MKVLLIGNGGREHALAWRLADSPRVTKLFAMPGNPGTAQVAENVAVDPMNFDAVQKFIRSKGIEFVVVGPATTIPYHRAILDIPDFRAGNLSTRFIEDHPQLVEQARKLAADQSPFDYGPDPRHVAAAAAAVASMVRR